MSPPAGGQFFIPCRLPSSSIWSCGIVLRGDMGSKQTTFKDEQLEEYQDCTFFTRKQILRLHMRFRELAPNLIPSDYTNSPDVTLPPCLITSMPELRENPFRQRIVETFSEDGKGNLSFNDFMDMFSIFSEKAPQELKIIYAFKIYDFNKDGYLCEMDVEKTVHRLTGKEFRAEERKLVARRIMEEADLDRDGKLSLLDFENMICKAPDFISLFHIRI